MIIGSFSYSHTSLYAAALVLVLTGTGDIALAQGRGGGRGGGPVGPTVSTSATFVAAGDTIDVVGTGFQAGQTVSLEAGGQRLHATPYVVDAVGRFTGRMGVPAHASTGSYGVTVKAHGAADSRFEVKISKRIPLSGQERFTASGAKLVRGLYQAAYSTAANAVYVTSAVGRPPVHESELLKVDPKTMTILAKTTPAAAPAATGRQGGGPPGGSGMGAAPGRGAPGGGGAPGSTSGPGVYAVYGVAIDDIARTVWVTNSRQNTVAVYRQSDLTLIKQFPVGAVPHARDVVVDAKRGRAYVSANSENFVAVFDTKTLEQLPNIEIASTRSGQTFAPASLELDAASGKLYTVGLRTSEAAVIDVVKGRVEKVIPLNHAEGAIGVAWDGGNKYLLVVSQGSDNLLIVDPSSGRTVHDVYVGAGALNVAYDPVHKLAYVSNRVAGTVAVVDPARGLLVANLDGRSSPNHVTADGKGGVFAVNKSRGAEDPNGDFITYIVPQAR